MNKLEAKEHVQELHEELTCRLELAERDTEAPRPFVDLLRKQRDSLGVALEALGAA